MIADGQVVADDDACGPEGGDFFQKARRINHDTVSNDGTELGPKDACGEQRELVRLSGMNDGMPGIGPAVVADDDIMLLGEKIDDLALGFVAPLQADNTGSRG
jgi:hypothetical protein